MRHNASYVHGSDDSSRSPWGFIKPLGRGCEDGADGGVVAHRSFLGRGGVDRIGTEVHIGSGEIALGRG